MAEKYDFQIDTLKFRAAPTNEFPYVRATAPFRKDQYDTTEQVGDQSLTGWWTRGQLSFHRGAGIRFYEVTDGSEVPERFYLSESVRIDTPGVVDLGSDEDANDGTLATVQKPWVAYPGGNSIWYIGASNGGYRTAFGGATTGPLTPSAGTASSVLACSLGPLGDRGYFAISNRVETDGGSGSTLSVVKTITNAGTINHLFYAKERWWVIQQTTFNLFVAPTGGASSEAGVDLGTLPSVESGTRYTLADTPGAVYLAKDQWILVVDVDTGAGTYSSPRVVADLGPGTRITSIAYLRGRLGICTRTGFSVANILADGSLEVGPEFINFHSSACRQMATRFDKMFVAGIHPLDAAGNLHSVYEVNFSEDVAELQPVWHIRQRAQVDSSGFTGTTTGVHICSGSNYGNFTYDYVAVPAQIGTGTKRVVASGIQGVGNFNRQTPGYVTTAQHRLGTLESKKFYSISVNAKVNTSSAGQNIQVYAVAKDDSETLLGTITTNGVSNTTFSLTGLTAAESLGFKFVLNRGSTANSTPELYGYQVKALPVPERQRLLRWPLAVNDINQLRRGTVEGRRGKAWSDLSALESLEKSTALVTFTDHRTGETGTAYIDSVEFQSSTPATATEHGFGGVAYVTLRVVS